MYLIYSNGEHEDIGSFGGDAKRRIFKAKCAAYSQYGERRPTHRDRCPVALIASQLEFFGIQDLVRHIHHHPHDDHNTPTILEGLPIIITYFE